MLFLKQRTALKEDAVIGLIFSSFFGLGLFLVSLSPTSVDVNTITLGNILAITPDDTLQLLLIAVISLAVLMLKWRDLMVVFFDETHARSIGLNPERLNLVFFHHPVCLLCCSVADGWRLSGDSAGDHAGRNSLSTDRSFPASADPQCHNRNGFQLSGCLCQLFSGWCDRWHNHMPADHSVRSCFPACPEAWPFNGTEADNCTLRLTTMIDVLLQPLAFSFMQKAFIIGLIISVPTAFLSCFLIVKGWSLMGDAISHAILPGVVLAYLLNLPLMIGAFAAGMCCALTTGHVAENCRVKRDTIMGVVFSGMFALGGLVLYTGIETDVHLDHILFGNMLGVDGNDLLTALMISICVSLFLMARWSDLLLQSFDPVQANAMGLNVAALHFGLLAALSMTIVATLKAAGLILAISLLIAPVR